MSAFHCGNRNLAVQHEKSLVPAFIKGPVNHLFGNLHVHYNDFGKINYPFARKSGKSLEF